MTNSVCTFLLSSTRPFGRRQYDRRNSFLRNDGFGLRRRRSEYPARGENEFTTNPGTFSVAFFSRNGIEMKTRSSAVSSIGRVTPVGANDGNAYIPVLRRRRHLVGDTSPFPRAQGGLSTGSSLFGHHFASRIPLRNSLIVRSKTETVREIVYYDRRRGNRFVDSFDRVLAAPLSQPADFGVLVLEPRPRVRRPPVGRGSVLPSNRQGLIPSRPYPPI